MTTKKTRPARTPSFPINNAPQKIISYRSDGSRFGDSTIFRTNLTRAHILSRPNIHLKPLHAIYEKELRKSELALSKHQADLKARIKKTITRGFKAPYAEKFTAGLSGVATGSMGALTGGTRPLGPILLINALSHSNKKAHSINQARKAFAEAKSKAPAALKDRMQQAALKQPIKKPEPLTKPKPQPATKPQPLTYSQPQREHIMRRLRRRDRDLKVAERER